MHRTIIAALALISMCAGALAQSSPGLTFGQVPTAAQWNSYFAGKVDYTGSPLMPSGGGTFTGKVNFLASASGAAGMNCGVGTTPSSPVDGDIWCTTVGMFVRINGSTVGPLGAGAGGVLTVPNGGTGVATITSGNVVIGQGASAVTSYPPSGTGTRIASTTITSSDNGKCVTINATGDLIANSAACAATGGGGTVASATTGQLAIYTNGAGAVVGGLSGCNSGYFGTNGGGTVSCATSLLAALQASITQVGTIATGVWNGTIVTGQYGGTGVANTGFTITLAGNLVTSGANSLTLTTIGATNVTLPTTGTLLNQNGTSGGIPYYNSTTTVQSSALLMAGLPVLGGGAGAAPVAGTTTTTNATTKLATYAGSAPASTHCAQWDANGNLSDSGATCAGASGGAVLLATLTASASSSLTDVGNCGTGGSTGCFTSTYLNYQIVLTNIVATTPSTNLGCQIQVWNGSYQATGYITAFLGEVAGTLTASNPTTYIPCFPVGSGTGASTLTAPGASASFVVSNPSAVAKAQWNGSYVASNNILVNTQAGGGWWNTAAALTGFRVCLGTVAGTCAGTIASGTVKVYGLP